MRHDSSLTPIHGALFLLIPKMRYCLIPLLRPFLLIMATVWPSRTVNWPFFCLQRLETAKGEWKSIRQNACKNFYQWLFCIPCSVNFIEWDQSGGGVWGLGLQMKRITNELCTYIPISVEKRQGWDFKWGIDKFTWPILGKNLSFSHCCHEPYCIKCMNNHGRHHKALTWCKPICTLYRDGWYGKNILHITPYIHANTASSSSMRHWKKGAAESVLGAVVIQICGKRRT